MASPWWTSINDGDQVPVGLIQFDLGGHSGWSAGIEESGSRYEAFESRKALQQLLRRAVDGFGFNMHHWAGDGGLFAGMVSNSADADRTYGAMAQMFSAFERWRSDSSSRNGLVCRITGTYIPDLCIDREPGNWFSSALNQFLKYERQLGRQGTIRITQELRRLLYKSSRNFSGNESKRVVKLPDGVYLSVFQDISHPIRVEESTHSFRYWLNQHKNSLSVVAPKVPLSSLPEMAHQIGDAIVLNASFEDSGYNEIYLNARGTSQISSDMFKTTQDRDWWHKISGVLTASHVRGTKFRVHSFTPELTDDPVVRVEWSQGSYVDSRAFHTMCTESPEVVHRYSADALKVMYASTNLPNTLSNHSIVVFGKLPERKLLMCHRRRGQRPGAYSRNCWSVSFEEQFNPIKDEISGKTLQQDFTIDDCIRRGAIEEILGSDYNGPVNISTHAFQLETSPLNFGFLGIVELPDLSFNEILQLWPTARDADEHDVLVAMPLQGDLIRNCLASARLPDAIVPQLQCSANFKDLKADDSAWHPTSLVRLALALWMSEQANLRSEQDRRLT